MKSVDLASVSSSLAHVPRLDVEDVSRAPACFTRQPPDADVHFMTVVAATTRFVERGWPR